MSLKSVAWSLSFWDVTGSPGISIPGLKLELVCTIGDKPEEHNERVSFNRVLVHTMHDVIMVGY